MLEKKICALPGGCYAGWPPRTRWVDLAWVWWIIATGSRCRRNPPKCWAPVQIETINYFATFHFQINRNSNLKDTQVFLDFHGGFGQFHAELIVVGGGDGEELSAALPQVANLKIEMFFNCLNWQNVRRKYLLVRPWWCRKCWAQCAALRRLRSSRCIPEFGSFSVRWPVRWWASLVARKNDYRVHHLL